MEATIKLNQDLIEWIQSSNQFANYKEEDQNSVVMAGFGRAVWFQLNHQDGQDCLPITSSHVEQKIFSYKRD